MGIDLRNPEGRGASELRSAPPPLASSHHAFASSPHSHEDDAIASHPAERPAEPDHPMMLNGQIVPGDVEIMARCLFEELLQVGIAPAEIAAMTHDSNYQALISMRQQLGAGLDAILDATVQRIGRHRFRTSEHTGHVQSASLTVSAAGR